MVGVDGKGGRLGVIAKRPLVLLAALAVCISVAFQILLSVAPVIAERAGPHGIAGAATAALFVGAATGELSTPWLLSRFRSTQLLVAGQLLTAFPGLIYLVPHPALLALLPATTARGFGMGVAIVVSVVVLSDLTARTRRGRAIGYYGLALSGPGVFVPSLGVFLLANGRADVDALIAFAAGLIGAVIALSIPSPRQAAGPTSNLLDALRRPGILSLFAGFVLASCSFSGVITYAPVVLPLDGLGSAASFLLVMGAARAASRWIAGVLGDRQPARLVLLCGMALSLAGLVVLGLHGGGALTVLAAAAMYGVGFGAIHTTSFLAMSERGTAADSGAISALWNSGIDVGGSLGGSLIGVAAASFGYAAAIWVLPAVAALALPLFLWPSKRVGGPPAEAEMLARAEVP